MGVALLVRAGTEGRSNAIRPASHEAGYVAPCAAKFETESEKNSKVD